jgi:hypothetical protein
MNGSTRARSDPDPAVPATPASAPTPAAPDAAAAAASPDRARDGYEPL